MQLLQKKVINEEPLDRQLKIRTKSDINYDVYLIHYYICLIEIYPYIINSVLLQNKLLKTITS